MQTTQKVTGPPSLRFLPPGNRKEIVGWVTGIEPLSTKLKGVNVDERGLCPPVRGHADSSVTVNSRAIRENTRQMAASTIGDQCYSHLRGL